MKEEEFMDFADAFPELARETPVPRHASRRTMTAREQAEKMREFRERYQDTWTALGDTDIVQSFLPKGPK